MENNEQTITVQMTVTEFNYLAALAEPAFRTVALFQKMREQAMAQTATAPPPLNANGGTGDQLHVSDR